jgi:hypothetical protein
LATRSHETFVSLIEQVKKFIQLELVRAYFKDGCAEPTSIDLSQIFSKSSVKHGTQHCETGQKLHTASVFQYAGDCTIIQPKSQPNNFVLGDLELISVHKDSGGATWIHPQIACFNNSSKWTATFKTFLAAGRSRCTYAFSRTQLSVHEYKDHQFVSKKTVEMKLVLHSKYIVRLYRGFARSREAHNLFA